MASHRVHLVDGTYEMFRMFFGAPPSTSPDGREVGATRALLRTLIGLLREPGVSHVAVAFDHVIESFRNQLFAGYKTGEGIDPALFSQFGLAERASFALGVVTWPMVEFEADDAIATAAHRFGQLEEVSQVVICSPDKDLQQCVKGERVIAFDRKGGRRIDENAVIGKFGVGPESIPDYLALVGDSADGIPGVPRWGAKSAGSVLGQYKHLENIPDNGATWLAKVRGATTLADSLREHREAAFLYRQLATLRLDVPLAETLSVLEWKGARRGDLELLCREIGEDDIVPRMWRWRDQDG